MTKLQAQVQYITFLMHSGQLAQFFFTLYSLLHNLGSLVVKYLTVYF